MVEEYVEWFLPQSIENSASVSNATAEELHILCHRFLFYKIEELGKAHQASYQQTCNCNLFAGRNLGFHSFFEHN